MNGPSRAETHEANWETKGKERSTGVSRSRFFNEALRTETQRERGGEKDQASHRHSTVSHSVETKHTKQHLCILLQSIVLRASGSE